MLQEAENPRLLEVNTLNVYMIINALIKIKQALSVFKKV